MLGNRKNTTQKPQSSSEARDDRSRNRLKQFQDVKGSQSQNKHKEVKMISTTRQQEKRKQKSGNTKETAGYSVTPSYTKTLRSTSVDNTRDKDMKILPGSAPVQLQNKSWRSSSVEIVHYDRGRRKKSSSSVNVPFQVHANEKIQVDTNGCGDTTKCDSNDVISSQNKQRQGRNDDKTWHEIKCLGNAAFPSEESVVQDLQKIKIHQEFRELPKNAPFPSKNYDWQSTSKNESTLDSRPTEAFSGTFPSKNKVWKNSSEGQNDKEDVKKHSKNVIVSKNRVWQRASNNRYEENMIKSGNISVLSQNKGRHISENENNHKDLIQSLPDKSYQDSKECSINSMTSSKNKILHDTLRAEDKKQVSEGSDLFSKNKLYENNSKNRTGNEKKPVSGHSSKSEECQNAKMIVIVKMLAGRYGEHVDVKKAAELVQICTHDFLLLLAESVSANMAFLTDLATFCHSALRSLPSPVCLQFSDIINNAQKCSLQSGNIQLTAKFDSFKTMLAEHTRQRQEPIVTDFHLVLLLPVEVCSFIVRPNLKYQFTYPSVQMYLSAQFYMLYEQFIGRIRDGIVSFHERRIHLSTGVRFIWGIHFLKPFLLHGKLCLVIDIKTYDKPVVGTLVCFSCDSFKTALYGVIVQSYEQILVELFTRITDELFDNEFIMVDMGIPAEPSYTILKILQRLETVPLSSYIVEGTPSRRCESKLLSVPATENLNLDTYQYEALKNAVSENVSLILGPPGSGKTHVACSLVRFMPRPVVVISSSESGLVGLLEHMTPLSVACLGSQAPENTGMHLQHMKHLEQDLSMIFQHEGVVSLLSFREAGVMTDQHFNCFLRRDRNACYYDWLVEEVSFHNESHAPRETPTRCFGTLFWTVQLGTIVKKRSEVHAALVALQDRWGHGEDVTAAMHALKERYRVLAFTLKKLKVRLESTQACSELLNCRDVWQLKGDDRWRLYQVWVSLLKSHLLEKLVKLHGNCGLEVKDAQAMLEDARKADVVLVTGMEAIRMRTSLQRLEPKTVIVDDATNIMEPHLVALLPHSCQRLVLLGETTPCVHPAREAQLSQNTLVKSLVYRLLHNGFSCSELKYQYRAAAALTVPILYAGESDSVEKCEIRGVSQNLFFITHVLPAEKVEGISDYKNVHEAKFLIEFCSYLLQQGHSPQDIAILTLYPSQKYYISEKCKNSLLLQDVSVALVEEFRGLERRLVMLSLVHTKGSWLYDIPLIGQMLSRAQEGLYIIGNLQELASNSSIWYIVQKTLERYNAVGAELQLKCQVHPDQLTAVSNAMDFLEFQNACCIVARAADPSVTK